MSGSYWKQVVEDDFGVPSDRPLDDLTAELTRMLGSTDPQLRDGTAYPALATWTDRGVYDDLLAGLGDGMAAGLTVGLGEQGTDSVFRRSFSVLILGECIAPRQRRGPAAGRKILEWGDRVATWYLRERDLRGFVPGKGWAHAVAHGADAIAALAESPHLGTNELTVLLDVLGDRLTLPVDALFTARRAGPDRVRDAWRSCGATWSRSGSSSRGSPGSPRPPGAARRRGRDPFLVRGNAEAFLRALYLQLRSRRDHPTYAPTCCWSWSTP